MASRQVDIHLLVVFEALLLERNVTRAAQRINLSQSATSKALAKLRGIFDDPLFMRSSGGVTPTHRALELAAPVQETLDSARGLLNPAGAFDPAVATTVFNIAATDYISLVVMPALLSWMAQHAPHAEVVVHDLESFTAEEVLLSGKVDLALASVGRVSRPLQRQALFEDHYVCVVRNGFPGFKKQLTLAQYAKAGHLVIPRQNGGGPSVVDDALSQHSLSRKAKITVPHFLAFPGILAGTDLIVTVPARTARYFSDHFPLQVSAHPLDLAPFAVSQLWHARTANSPSHVWLRQTISALCEKI